MKDNRCSHAAPTELLSAPACVLLEPRQPRVCTSPPRRPRPGTRRPTMARPREMLRAIVRLATSAASGCARPPVPVAGVSSRVLPRNHAPTSTFGIGAPLVVASTARFTRGVVSSYRATGAFGSARHYARAAGDDETGATPPRAIASISRFPRDRFGSSPTPATAAATPAGRRDRTRSSPPSSRYAQAGGPGSRRGEPPRGPTRVSPQDTTRSDTNFVRRSARRKRAVERRRHDQVKELGSPRESAPTT